GDGGGRRAGRGWRHDPWIRDAPAPQARRGDARWVRGSCWSSGGLVGRGCRGRRGEWQGCRGRRTAEQGAVEAQGANTQLRSRRKRATVASRLAAVSTTSVTASDV